ncbi:MAG: ABC transporter ATP-binding protein [Rhodospirillaceae bacterium]|nr:ABC transporter ATP-binding protein [Rhodospirillaceae bacterium]
MSLLSVQGLSKSFGALKVLDDISFTVESGQMVAMIGPNGAGKSTCFSIIGGQLRPDSGRVLLEGRDMAGQPPHLASRMGLGRTFQTAATFASMSVAENIRLAILARQNGLNDFFSAAARSPLPEERSILEEVGITALADSTCADLAYGDLKRVELALALAGAPRLLLMDEPAAGMAGDERNQLMRLVGRLARERGLGILFTEHDIGMVFDHADKVLALIGGRIAAAGPPDSVRAHPAVVAGYLGG